MHLLTTPLLYRILSFKASPQTANLLAVGLSVMFATVMVVHMVMDEFLLHAVTFGLQVALIVYYTTKMIPESVPEPVAQWRLKVVARFGVGQ